MRIFAFLALIVSLSSCYKPSEHPKPFFFQDSVYQAFSEDTINLSAKPFSIVFGLEGWEVQAADTGISLSYVITSDLNQHDKFFTAVDEKTLIQNFEAYKVPIEQKHELVTSEKAAPQIMRHVLKRFKGRQECYFSRCKESPALLRLILDVKTIDDFPVRKLSKSKYLYFFTFRSNEKKYTYKGYFKIN